MDLDTQTSFSDYTLWTKEQAQWIFPCEEKKYLPFTGMTKNTENPVQIMCLAHHLHEQFLYSLEWKDCTTNVLHVKKL